VREQMLADLVSAATAEVESARRRARPRDPWLAQAAAAAVAVAGLWGALAAWPAYQFPLMLERIYAPWRDLPKPSFMQIAVVPDAIRIGRGEELVVQAEITGELPWLAERILRLAGNDTRRCVLEIAGQPPAEMARVHRRLFLATRGDVREPLEFRVRCGDARTRQYPVEVVTQPALASLVISITPPAYTGRPVEELSALAGPLPLLVGSRVAVEFRADQDLEAAEVTVAGRPVPDVAWDGAARTGRFTIAVDDSREITIDLVNRQGFHALRPTVIAIEAVPDQAPVVQLESPATESEQVPAALVPVRATVEDDLAIRTAAVIWQLNPQLDPDAPLRELPLELAASDRTTLAIDAAFDLDATAAVPGDEILAFVRARDSAGNDGESAAFTLRVVSFTRGENERQRLAVLRWLAVAVPAVQAAGGGPLADDVAAAVVEEAKRLGLPDDAETSLAAVLALLEREIYLSETSPEKQDAIAIAGLLAAGRTVAAETILNLTGRRRLENVLVRLFGMRTEAGRLREAIAAGSAQEAVGRRATLGLRSLEAIGADLLDLARGLPAAGLDPEGLVAMQAELNEAGYRMTRGSTSKRAEACDTLAAGITALIATVRPGFEGLARLEADARGRLAEAVAALGVELARPADQPTGEAAREWFRRRLDLLDLDPCSAGSEMLAALAGATGGQPPAIAPATAAAEREWWRWLSAEQERERLTAVADMADDERTLLAGLLAARLPAAAPPARPFAEAVSAVAAAAGPLVLPDARAAATGIVAAIETLLASESAEPVSRAAAVTGFEREAAVAVTAAAARSRIGELAAGGSFADDVLLLRLRDAILRYRQNTRLAAADADSGPDAWRRPLVGLAAGLAKMVAAADSGALTADEAVERSPFLVAARQSRLVRDAAATGDRGLLERGWPEAADLGLADGLPLLREAAAAVDAADRALAGDPPSGQEWRRLRGDIERPIAAFSRLAAESEELAGPLAAVASALAAVDRPTGQDAIAVRTRRLVLGELASAVAALGRRAGAVIERADADPGGFEGGPEQIWGAASRREALFGRRMVVDAWRAARGRGVTAVLGGGDSAAVAAAALPWAASAMRLGLSELGGAARGGGRQRQQEAKGDPLAAWLRREIDAARKAVRTGSGPELYQKATLEYLDRVDDLLRY
jgi:hypothetical protein